MKRPFRSFQTSRKPASCGSRIAVSPQTFSCPSTSCWASSAGAPAASVRVTTIGVELLPYVRRLQKTS
ncbi:MAG TPA: hypothetical protein VF698_17285 [Thermoanaerobaculia bacterium]